MRWGSIVALVIFAIACSSKSGPPIEGTYDPVDAGRITPREGGTPFDSGVCAYPAVMHLTVGGFTTCTCLNGTFTLVHETGGGTAWRSDPINGCPGQTVTGYFKFMPDDPPAIGVGELVGQTGDYSPSTSFSCNPLAVAGGGSVAGNSTGICNTAEDTDMHWSLGP